MTLIVDLTSFDIDWVAHGFGYGVMFIIIIDFMMECNALPMEYH